MTATIALSGLISLGTSKTLSEYIRLLPKDLINLESITECLNPVDDYNSGKRSQVESVTSFEFILDLDLQSLSSHMKSFSLNLAAIVEANKVSTASVTSPIKTNFTLTNNLFGILGNNVPLGLLKLKKSSRWKF